MSDLSMAIAAYNIVTAVVSENAHPNNHNASLCRYHFSNSSCCPDQINGLHLHQSDCATRLVSATFLSHTLVITSSEILNTALATNIPAGEHFLTVRNWPTLTR